VKVGVAPVALLAAAGFGSPQPGTHVEVGGGPGAYHYSAGCDGPHNYASFVALQARARHMWPNGLVMAGEVAGQRDEVVRSDPEGSTLSDLGRRDTQGVLALRFGFEGRYGGVEFGPAVFRTGVGQSGHRPETTVLPSVRLWAGRYGVAHAWASLLADRTLPTNRIFGFGIGHASARVRASLGLAGSAGQDGTIIADADLAVWRGLWLGAGGQFTDNDDTWALLGRVGYFWGTPEAPAHQPAVETPAAPAPPAAPAVPQPDAAAAPAPSVEVEGVPVDAGA
jgi:hypothetical protein